MYKCNMKVTNQLPPRIYKSIPHVAKYLAAAVVTYLCIYMYVYESVSRNAIALMD